MTTKNPYADYMKMFSDYKMPGFDYSKVMADFKAPAVDFNKAFSMQRRNIEAFSAANQAMTEGAQAMSRRQAELVRLNVEKMLKATKDMMVSGSPEINTSKQAELTNTLLKSSLDSLRELSEMAAKSGFEAFDVINKRTAESIEEISSMTKAA